MKHTLLLLLTLVLSACQPTTETEESKAAKGFDKFGFVNACASVSTGICPDSWDYQADDQFQVDCSAAGLKVVECACGPSLCSGRMLTGLDRIGNVRSCAANPRIQPSCQDTDGAAEDFIEDCKSRGGQAVMCGCNDYICVGAATP